ncbi:hypothetical protein AMK59_1189 [Oryctes borbonicus]|uniref:Death domain-containing protein n=1 Tax=Oryctes borbonicus TaxID=1629725 RepID=A0A0T6BCT5_9SCAR|nr:hypothetical protein AMK59_1189 [Oryctes borbonicus]
MEQENMYIYHLPHYERRQLCIIIDQNNLWEELAGTHMKYDINTIYLLRQEILRGKSPTDELLALWGQQNHTVLELFILLNRMKHYQGMMIIKKFVPVPYHKLIKHAQHNINRLLQDLQLQNDLQLKNNKIPEVNLDKVENKPVAESKNVQAFLSPPLLRVMIPPKDVNHATQDDNITREPNNKLLKPVSPQVSKF